MKGFKYIAASIAAAALLCFPVFASESFGLENDLGSLTVVNNTLGSGGSAVFGEGFIGSGVELDGSYGLKIGNVDGDFTVGAMVSVTNTGDAKTVFFKNMGDASAQKWTGAIYAQGYPALWTHDSETYKWHQVTKASQTATGVWTHVVYTESGGVGSLYVNGALIGSGNVASGGGTIYAGATFWSADTVTGKIDEIYFDDEKAATAEEVKAMFSDYAIKALTLPGKVTGDLTLPSELNGEPISWSSSNKDVISDDGKVTRGIDDTEVVMTAFVDGKEIKSFTVIVLKMPSVVNDKVVLSYDFSGGDGVVLDNSGNGNHAAAIGGMKGGVFDGVDDYVELPEGILSDLDEFSIIIELTPDIALTNYFTFGFGNSSTEGYFFLNTSRPETNTIRLAITDASYPDEKDIRSVPGIRKGERAVVVVTSKGSEYALYVNGIPVANGDMGMSVKDLGETKCNYIGKSLYSADPLYSGEMSEFTILPYVMDASDIRAKYELPQDGDNYIESVSPSGNGFTVDLARDCMVSAVFYDESGNKIYFATRKISDDNLTAVFDCEGAVTAEIAAFDAATGIIKDKKAVSFFGGVFAYTEDGGNVRVINTSGKTLNAAVINARYQNGNELASADISTVSLAPDSFEIVPLDFTFEEQRLFVWTSLAEMTPIKEYK